MRGVVLAGGTGSRLADLTRAVNKHLLPVGGRPMIYWPLRILCDSFIRDVTIVSSARGVGQLAELLGGGYTYRVQDRPGGIAQAIACADDGTDRSVVVILGDNIFLTAPRLDEFRDSGRACCFLKIATPDKLRECGVPTFDQTSRRITVITEKPDTPASPYVVTGLYVFSPDVFRRISGVGASARGEMEITDLLNTYADDRLLDYTVVDRFWGDAGTLEGMSDCNTAIEKWVDG